MGAKKHGGHHGGAWKVAYADFITAMMALFLVLWLTAQDKRIKEAVERAFRNPFSSVTKESVGIIPNKDTSERQKAEGQFNSVSAVEMEMMRHISEDLAKILQQQDENEKSVQLDLTADGLRINVFDRSHRPIFEPRTDAFTDYGAWVFSTLAWEISRFSSFRIELEGHTAASAEDSPEARTKWELSAERANAARRKLLQSGVVETQFCKVSGYADTAPMPDLPSADEANRRVTVVLRLKESTPKMETATAVPASNDRHPN
jgi:chemotaxis protein MotB